MANCENRVNLSNSSVEIAGTFDRQIGIWKICFVHVRLTPAS